MAAYRNSFLRELSDLERRVVVTVMRMGGPRGPEQWADSWTADLQVTTIDLAACSPRLRMFCNSSNLVDSVFTSLCPALHPQRPMLSWLCTHSCEAKNM